MAPVVPSYVIYDDIDHDLNLDYGIPKLGKVNNQKVTLLAASKHNKRLLPPTASIDPSRSNLNYDLHSSKTAFQINHEASRLMAEAKVPKRKNRVLAVEALFSLPVDWHEKDNSHFFADCYAWIQQYFSSAVLLSFDVHLDERAPHAHALLLPLINGKMQGSAMVGNRENLRRFKQNFYISVGNKYGLVDPGLARLKLPPKEVIASQVRALLRNDPARQSQIWDVIETAITKYPLAYAQQLGLFLPISKKQLEKYETLSCV